MLCVSLVLSSPDLFSVDNNLLLLELTSAVRRATLSEQPSSLIKIFMEVITAVITLSLARSSKYYPYTGWSMVRTSFNSPWTKGRRSV
jgi:hypothetical protein